MTGSQPQSQPPPEAPLTEVFAAARGAHEQGELPLAQTLYTALLAEPSAVAWPGRAEALRLLGLVQAATGAPVAAEASLRAALAARQDLPLAAANLADLLAALGRGEEAITAYRAALKLAPREVETLHRLGDLLRAEGRAAEAVPVYRQALAIAPQEAALRLGMGLALLGHGRADAAVSALLRARTIDPALPGVSLALGEALAARGDWAQALPVLRAALAEQPDDAAALLALARALLALGDAEAAAAALDRGLARRPGDPALLAMRGRALLAQGRPAAALAALRPALAKRPPLVEVLVVAGLALRALARPAEAAARLAAAIVRDPTHTEARHALALARLTLGDYATGWPDFALRLHADLAPPTEARLRQPRWTGAEELSGRRILLYAEQPVEDTLQFLRYVPMVAGLGAQVVLRVQPALHPLVGAMPAILADPHIELLPPGAPAGAFDLRCALADLPGAFATTLPTVPAATPYLAAPPDALARVRAALEQPTPGDPPTGVPRRIAIAWNASGPSGLPPAALVALLELLATQPATLYALGPSGGDGEAAALQRFPALVDLRPACADAVHLAAALACMDLVVAVDGPVLHLAGALGRPVWALLPPVADWRWMLRQRHSPWYPSTRLFRAATRSSRRDSSPDWSPVLVELAAALADM